ncbi:hypothetical protein ACNHKD_03600 [Methylocystis sp. JAN1]|uniref:hypothetical protein n=1 Tax=Methylocystis sp. JAN1 TaxID=3397211 RepID=UPI003FA257D6
MNKLRCLVALIGALLVAGTGHATSVKTSLHFAGNNNFDNNGNYVPSRIGFNLADVASVSLLNALPSGVKGLVWIGQCGGATASFVKAVQPYIGNPKVWGFYLFDDAYAATCNPTNLKAESDWVHANVPGAKVFIELANGASSKAPSYAGYNLATTGADYLGIAAYPCRSELNNGAGGCDFAEINRNVAAAQAAGIPNSAIVPIYQTFGGGNWINDGGGTYLLPTAAQAQQILSTWASLVPTAAFDYAYSWGSQNADVALESSPDLQQVFIAQNGGGGGGGGGIAASPPLVIGGRAKTMAAVDVRSRPLQSSRIVCKQPAGAIGTVVNGPVSGSGYQWWSVAFDSVCKGWVVQNYLAGVQ